MVKNIMIKIKYIIFALVICIHNSCNGENLFKLLNNGNIVSPDGIEYVFFANEGKIITFGERAFLGKIQFEYSKLHHLGGSWKTGMYSCDDSNMDILYRIKPNSEWGSYYRKVNLSPMDLRPENCIRFEFISYREIIYFENSISPDKRHIFCNDGLNDREEIQLFLNEISNGKSPEEAGLYNMIKKDNGFLENCYLLGYIYGYFDKNNIATPFRVWSFNDLGYAIDTNNGQHIISIEWLEKLGFFVKK